MGQRKSVLMRYLVLAVVGLLGACQRQTPEEKIEALRSQYSATLNSITIDRADAGGEDAPSSAEATVVLDILLSTETFEKLPGVTMDVSQVDAQRQEKERWRIWVDTTDLERGSGTQITHTLEAISYQEGDGFHVEVRVPIPAAERASYREFSQ